MSEKTKIVEVIPALGIGGAEKLVCDICSNMNREKFDLTLIVFYDEKEKLYYKNLQKIGVKIVSLNKKGGFQPVLFFRLAKILNKIKPDVIHSHLSSNLYLCYYYFWHKKQYGVHTIHNQAEKELNGHNRKIMQYLYRHRNVKAVAISDEIEKSVFKVYDIAKEKVALINNGVDLNRYAAPNRQFDGCKNFVAVGRLSKQKNHQLMLNAFKRIVEKHPDAKLNILGDGDLRPAVEKQIAEGNLQNNVQLLGNGVGVEEFLAAADCFLMSSNFEGLPLSMVEAMASGLPIVSTKAGGITDLVCDGENGFLAELGDENGLVLAMEKMIANEYLMEMSKKSIEKAKEYSIDICVSKYETLFANE